jgi:hypothetical protein
MELILECAHSSTMGFLRLQAQLPSANRIKRGMLAQAATPLPGWSSMGTPPQTSRRCYTKDRCEGTPKPLTPKV